MFVNFSTVELSLNSFIQKVAYPSTTRLVEDFPFNQQLLSSRSLDHSVVTRFPISAMLTLAIFLVSSLAFFGTNADEQENPCKSFGIDIQGGGSYFQNSLSSDPFTANQEFKGCQNDTANNVIVDPSGDQTQCSDTPINPDGTPFTVTW